ncbi:HAAS signaling domain-containing protein [Cellulomonas chengniuliangii]|uniref:Zinc-finger domain-containing protein n=1 Tax=Cellulomonas chengniuliangii TaxID=2968084 RepID=A0ABY5KYW7_9CELL|nr:hypothetical protein [Cellulomonas chengniuliangii]MCC2309961.1 hypothetical protein [Cellulomonas chengniuliangii]MCC2317063.1 hypothetical protein [Cellulomonas chengniuliangii]UUI74636.1 hypothetical protein NP064_12670 [Cellulomonas chengniuliangii]
MPGQHLSLVESYLDDLDRALAGIDPAERADVVASIREHVDASLGDQPTAADVHEVLQRLGPVERIAREADAGAPALIAFPEPTPGASPDDRWPRWSGPVLLGLGALAIALIPTAPVAAVALALAAGIAALIGVRRAPGPTSLLRAAVALCALAILLTALAAATLLNVRAELPSIDTPVEVVSPGGG